jgi:mxaJ protein
MSGINRVHALFCIFMVGLVSLSCSMQVMAADPRTAFKVCADPVSLPSSNKEQQGYENKIAQLFAADLKLPLQYEWFPQRIGFIRNTLKNNDTPDSSYKCDIVMGVPDNFELAATSKPYMHSAWAMVFAKGRGLDEIKSPGDLVNLAPEKKKKLRIGVFDRSPAVVWLQKNSLMEYAIPYQIMDGDPNSFPGQIIKNDLVNDKINITFVWGPIAGYFAKQIKTPEIVVLPMQSEPGIKFDYRISMAVRHGEKSWKEQINQLLDKHKGEIDKILNDYGIPLLNN